MSMSRARAFLFPDSHRYTITCLCQFGVASVQSAKLLLVLALVCVPVSSTLLADSLTSKPVFDTVPPNPALISVGQMDAAGSAAIIGAAGAVNPNAKIIIVNQHTGQYIMGNATPSGSFTYPMFAPPGSSISIHQHSTNVTHPASKTQAAGTMIHVPVPGEAQGAFATTALVGSELQQSTHFTEIATKGQKDSNRLWMSGTLVNKTWSAGQSGNLQGSAILYSKGVQDFNLGNYNFSGIVTLERIFDASGKQEHAFPEAMSHVLTPSGFPIERRRSIDAIKIGNITFGSFTKTGTERAETTWTATYQLPADLPNGIYQLMLVPTANLPQHQTLYFADIPATNFMNDRYFSTTGVAHITVGTVANRKLTWVLGMNDFSQGSRGVVAVEDRARFQIAPHIITSSKDYILPAVDPRTGNPLVYRLEPFVPMISAANKGTPNPPTVNFVFPSGNLHVRITRPDGSVQDLGSAPFASPYIQEPSSPSGRNISLNSNKPSQFFGLTTLTTKYDISFQQYGLHTVTVTGFILDTEGKRYDGGGTYEIWVAKPLDFEEGVFPGTPFEVGDAYAPTVVVQPGVPADIEIRVRHFPNSDKTAMVESVISGRANDFGYFYPSGGKHILMSSPGEYRVDYTAQYVDESGVLWMGSSSWGSIVETSGTRIVTNGRRGFDTYFANQQQWPTLFDDDVVFAHLQFPFNRGDVMWMEEAQFEPRNIANVPALSLQDPDGTLTAIMRPRANSHNQLGFNYPLTNSFDGRALVGEIPLFSSSSSTISPALRPTATDTHWGYSYTGVARPGVRVREMVSEDAYENGYWRFNDAYNYQYGNGTNGDLTNDFKFQFGGAVYRAPNQNFYFYGAYASLFVLLPQSEPKGGRITPPFQGASGGPNGGPLMTLKGKAIDMFFHPTGLRPGSILRTGNVVSFSGQLAPTLPSKVTVSITSPSGVKTAISGQANKVGYFYKPGSDFVVTEPGAWTVNISVLHDGETSSGPVDQPYPTGDVLGSNNGQFQFYVIDEESSLATINVPKASIVKPGNGALSLPLSLPSGLSDVQLHYTTVMPGFVMDQGVSNNLTYSYNAPLLAVDFPNLDLTDEDGRKGVDTVTMSFMLSGSNSAGKKVFLARQVLLQGEELLALDPVVPTTGNAQLSITDSTLRRGEQLTVKMDLSGSGVVDVYVALVLPNGAFITLGSPLALSNANAIIPFKLAQNLVSARSYSVVDVPLPGNVELGNYKFFGVVVKAGENVADQSKWISVAELPFSISQ